MRVLVVDAFAKKSEERKLWAEFKLAVRKALNNVDIGGMNVEYICRKGIDKYIYKGSDPQSGTKGLKTFDRLDMVFIGASADLFPWQKEAHDLFILIKMCHVTKKCVFGSSAVGHFLSFCCCTNGIEIKPINGIQGSQLETFDAEYYAGKVHIETRDVFLDKCTGDLYKYDKNVKQWAPFTNVGFKKRSSQRNPTIKHISEVISNRQKPLVSKAGETRCRIKSHQVNHWMFKGIKQREFTVRNRPKWILDETSNLRSGSPYHVLAEGAMGPLLIKSHNFIAAHFDVTREYPQSVQMVSNFVRAQVEKFKQHGYVDQSSRLYLCLHSQSDPASMHEANRKAIERGLIAKGNTIVIRSKEDGKPGKGEKGLTESNTGIKKNKKKKKTTTTTTNNNNNNNSNNNIDDNDGKNGQRKKNVAFTKLANKQKPSSDPKKRVQPKIAAASECVFLRTNRSEYKLQRRSAEKWAHKREQRRPVSSYKPKSNFSENANKNLSEKEISTIGTMRRLEAAKKKRDAEFRFPSTYSRPRSAPMHAVRRSRDEVVHAAAHKMKHKNPLYDKFNLHSLGTQTNAIQNKALTATHTLRVFKLDQRLKSSSDLMVEKLLKRNGFG